MSKNTRFALYFGNRGFFAESLISGAREEMERRLGELGYGTIMMPADATRYGAVETPAEGKAYAEFLAQNRGNFDGVIICLPNFGDETGAVASVRDAGVPILVHAYPDELDKMDMSVRRDAFCGKLSVMDVLYQYGVPFTALEPHVVRPDSGDFAANIDTFARICRVVNGMRRFTVGAVGARTTAFKTVRFDELTLQKYGITTEALDLSEVFMRVRDVEAKGEAFKKKSALLADYSSWNGVPEGKLEALCRLGVVLDELIDEYEMDALSLRCWLELQKELGVSPCVLLSELNDRGFPAACELDVCNAVAMRALHLASDRPPICLDWNNNYGEDRNKCILFHCGPVAQSLMTGKGRIVDHPMFAKAIGPGNGFGCNTGRISPTPFTYASSKTENGKLYWYLGEGEFTRDPVPEEFFGCAGVAQIEDLQKKLVTIGKAGYRHHVSVTPGLVENALRESFKTYLNYQVQ